MKGTDWVLSTQFSRSVTLRSITLCACGGADKFRYRLEVEVFSRLDADNTALLEDDETFAELVEQGL